MSITLYLSIIIYCETNTYLWGLAQGAQHKFQKALLGAYYLHTSTSMLSSNENILDPLKWIVFLTTGKVCRLFISTYYCGHQLCFKI